MNHELFCGDFRDHVVDCDMIFADPPDNIGLGYSGYKDKIPEFDYYKLLKSIVELGCKHSPHVFISFNSRWTLGFGNIV
jgi:DNA modification methylase